MAATQPMLALESGERASARNVMNLGVLLGGIGSLMALAALIAAWVSVSHFAEHWPPEDADMSNYDGTMLAVTMLMSAVTVEWAISSVRKGLRAQAATGFAITAGLGASFVLLLWFFGSRVGFGPSESPFGVLLFAILAVSGICVTAGTLLLLSVTARVLGYQVNALNSEMARAAGWFWQCLVLGWIGVYTTVWLFS